jgi:hypothetical protein
MKTVKEHFFCSPKLLENLDEIKEIDYCIENVEWKEDFAISFEGKTFANQRGYNKALEIEFKRQGWETQPKLYHNPRLIGDFGKNDVFIEVQFGNSATLYRDYYKFHYGLTHKKLVLAVLIVPTNPKEFFPTRKKSVSNMAEYRLADKYINLLPIPVPILLIGLLPEN